MSYGEVYIESDLKKESIKKVATRLHRYYPYIPYSRAYKIVKHIKKNGINIPNPHWKATKSEIAKQKRKERAMKEFNLKEVN